MTDPIPPVIMNCPSDITPISCTNADTIQVTWQEPNATDNYGMVNLQSQTHQPGESFPLGITEVTYTFVDPSGNVAVCQFYVAVAIAGNCTHCIALYIIPKG